MSKLLNVKLQFIEPRLRHSRIIDTSNKKCYHRSCTNCDLLRIFLFVCFQMLYGKEQKGPVSALTQVNGYLVSAIGQKVCWPSSVSFIKKTWHVIFICNFIARNKMGKISKSLHVLQRLCKLQHIGLRKDVMLKFLFVWSK